MEEQITEIQPSAGKSLAFAIGFTVAYVVVLFIVLAVFFTLPF